MLTRHYGLKSSRATGRTQTCVSVPVEHVDVHEVLQVLGERAPVQPGELVGALDALGLPVRPVQLVLVYGEAEGVRQLAVNQNLGGGKKR